MDSTLYQLRNELNDFDVSQIYEAYNGLFTIKLHHGGHLTPPPCRDYVNGKINYFDLVSVDTFCVKEFHNMVEDLGYDCKNRMSFYYCLPDTNLDFGLESFHSQDDVNNVKDQVGLNKEVSFFIEHEESVSRINSEKETSHEDTDLGKESNEDDDSDFYVDEENHLEDFDVDMKDFHCSIDRDTEFMGNASKTLDVNTIGQEIVTIESINDDQFDSDYDYEDDIEGERKKKLRELRQQVEQVLDVTKSNLYLGQEFGTKNEAMECIKLHAIETQRDIVFKYNDNRRLRAVCRGLKADTVQVPVTKDGNNGKGICIKEKGNNVDVVSTKEKGKSVISVSANDKGKNVIGDTTTGKKKWKKRDFSNLDCKWVVHVSKCNASESWQVVTYEDKHKCSYSREVKHCTYDFLATQLVGQLPSNPRLPAKAVKVQAERQYGINVSHMKAYRALRKARTIVEGDYAEQYAYLRVYLEELKKAHPGSTVIVETEPCDDDGTIFQFQRVYICLEPLKRGFQALGRELLGLDGAFMKEPATGQLLTAVGVDSNNGIYPVAYAIVEKETYNSWLWFLNNLGNDLDLTARSNFTFISDRQKGLLPAIERLYPVAEHRYCLRHLHENMKKKWNGVAYKQRLWRCATATTVPEFEKQMKELKGFNEACYKYLADIPPHHWARSHFSGRAKTDVLLSNMCEILNRWLVEARDKPIITALEYIREYLMKRIVKVNLEISKSDGPLTPGATKVFETIKKESQKYHVLWNGDQLYQVTGPHDQVVVDMNAKVCACRKWELTAMPCKHAVAALNYMGAFGTRIGHLESWVDRVHWLDTWRDTYNHKICPMNCNQLWGKSLVTSKLLPPKIVATAGRPKKNRRKGIDEKATMNMGGKLSRQGKTTRCGKCFELGHNQRGCTKTGGVGETSGAKRKKNQSGGNKKTKVNKGPKSG